MTSTSSVHNNYMPSYIAGGLSAIASGLKTTFDDENLDFDYDQTISKTRQEMIDKNPCECQTEINVLIRRLEQIKEKYWYRPCWPGFCLDIMIPHRSRIRGRITELKKRRTELSQECIQYMHEAKQNKTMELYKEQMHLYWQTVQNSQRIEKGVPNIPPPLPPRL